MATNIPAKFFDTDRFAVGAAVEVGIVLEAVRIIRYIKIQSVDAVDVRLSFTPGGTFDDDNFWTIKSGENWEVNDMRMEPQDAVGTFFYCRSEGAAVTLEVIWAQG